MVGEQQSIAESHMAVQNERDSDLIMRQRRAECDLSALGGWHAVTPRGPISFFFLSMISLNLFYEMLGFRRGHDMMRLPIGVQTNERYPPPIYL